ncbi:MAG: PilZ domain-containing protein [Phycisphaerae bacterium]|nr:PilZ domain-containing protein [Phycisphaerae bacterium]
MIFDEVEPQGNALNADEAFGLLQELGRNTTEEIRRQRAHFRISVKAGVVLQSGNASESLSMKVRGVTGDVSEGGFSGLFPVPPRVGDIYRLQFDREKLDLPLTFARCVRCRLVREDAFEAGFAFFKNICLPDRMMQTGAGAQVLDL